MVSLFRITSSPHSQVASFLLLTSDFSSSVSLQTWKRIATEAGCNELFEKSGLTDIKVKQRNVGYFLDSAEEWWDIVWNAGFRRSVGQLTPVDRERFKQEHLREVDALRTDEGIRLDVNVLFTVGKRH